MGMIEGFDTSQVEFLGEGDSHGNINGLNHLSVFNAQPSRHKTR